MDPEIGSAVLSLTDNHVSFYLGVSNSLSSPSHGDMKKLEVCLQTPLVLGFVAKTEFSHPSNVLSDTLKGELRRQSACNLSEGEVEAGIIAGEFPSL